MRTLAPGVQEFGKPGAERIRIWWLEKETNPERRAKRQRWRRVYETLAPGTTVKAAAEQRAYLKKRAQKGKTTTPGSVRLEHVLEEAEKEYKKNGRPVPRLTRLRAHFADWKVAAIDYSTLNDFIRACQEAELANGSIRVALAYLHHAFKLAQRAGLIAQIPDFPTIKVANTRTCWLKVEQLDGLLKLLRPRTPHLAAAVEFAFLTGWRQGNVFGLTWDFVDFQRGTATAPRGTTKNGEPFVTPFGVKSRLNALLREQERRTGGTGRVFPVERRWRAAWDRAVGPQGINAWGTQETAAGSVKVRPTFHSLRHSFMQHMLYTGVDWRTVKALGGWRTDGAAERYGYEDERLKRAALERRDAHLAEERAAAKTDKQQIVKLKVARA